MDTNFESASAALDSIRDAIRNVNRARLHAGLARDTARHARASEVLEALKRVECDALALCLHDMGRTPA